MPDRRQDIVVAALAVLREHGYAGFTQPRVAAKAGVRQSHLTYYFPTRADLLVTVAGAAAEAQLAFADALLDDSSPAAAGASIARLVAQAENTRVLLTLVCASDDVPGVREVFRALADGMVAQGRKMLASLDARPIPEAPYLLHALSVGLAAITFATGQPDGEAWMASVLEAALKLLSAEGAT